MPNAIKQPLFRLEGVNCHSGLKVRILVRLPTEKLESIAFAVFGSRAIGGRLAVD